ncbi:MAG: arsenate reductase ArsC [Candidatus Omnitrophica bacterium]|jgi:arsenate reductase|nr:arsenate reductase ArsC [Candidatus Omnitrophota bacterium]
MEKKKVLFICKHNSARSQMAEGLLKNFFGDYYEVYSAGAEPSTVNPFAIKAMEEIGIDISRQRSKSINEFIDSQFDYVITVCDSAETACPFFSNSRYYVHKSFKDPSQISGSHAKKLEAFRNTRDEIKQWMEKSFFKEIGK